MSPDLAEKNTLSIGHRPNGGEGAPMPLGGPPAQNDFNTFYFWSENSSEKFAMPKRKCVFFLGGLERSNFLKFRV